MTETPELQQRPFRTLPPEIRLKIFDHDLTNFFEEHPSRQAVVYQESQKACIDSARSARRGLQHGELPPLEIALIAFKQLYREYFSTRIRRSFLELHPSLVWVRREEPPDLSVSSPHQPRPSIRLHRVVPSSGWDYTFTSLDFCSPLLLGSARSAKIISPSGHHFYDLRGPSYTQYVARLCQFLGLEMAKIHNLRELTIEEDYKQMVRLDNGDAMSTPPRPPTRFWWSRRLLFPETMPSYFLKLSGLSLDRIKLPQRLAKLTFINRGFEEAAKPVDERSELGLYLDVVFGFQATRAQSIMSNEDLLTISPGTVEKTWTETWEVESRLGFKVDPTWVTEIGIQLAYLP